MPETVKVSGIPRRPPAACLGTASGQARGLDPAAVKLAIARDLAAARDEFHNPLGRTQVAERMSHLAGRRVTAAMLNDWAAGTKPHQIPLVLVDAFRAATGGAELASLVKAALLDPEERRCEELKQHLFERLLLDRRIDRQVQVLEAAS